MEEKQLLEKRSDTHALNVEEDVRFTAGRSFDNYRKYAPYVLSILGALIVAGVLSAFLRHWGARLEAPAGVNPVNGAIVSAVMAALSLFFGAFFTAVGLYDRLGRVAGGGSIIPITGFANSVVSPALEYNREGVFFGVCAKMFVIAGPIIVFGVVSGIVVGVISLLV